MTAMRTIPEGVTIKETVVREISAVIPNDCWTRVIIDEDTGRVVIVSDYGDWTYCWRHIGDKTLPEFLAQLNSSYMGEKMLGSALRVPSDEKSIEFIKKEILSLRKDQTITKEEAADEWEIVKRYADGDMDFRMWCDETVVFRDDSWAYQGEEVDGRWINFWEKLWAPFIKPALQSLSTTTNKD